jgi:hypothetical protein
VEGRDGGVPCGEPMGEEGGLLAAGETSYHKWRRGRLLQVVCVLAPGEGSNAYGHARAMRTPLMTTRDSPDRRTSADSEICTCMHGCGPAVAPAAHRLYDSRRAARRRRSAASIHDPYKMKICGWRAPRHT